MKKAIELVGIGRTLELSKGTGLRIKKNLLHLDELSDGTWRMTYTSTLLPAAEVLNGITLSLKGRGGVAHLTYDGFPSLEMPISRIAPLAPPAMPAGDRSVPFILHFEQSADGTWRLLYSKALIPDIYQLSELKVLRNA